ncbi:MAG: hypothetical protein J7L47_10305 [Candidatus Odinarchaeota archaeon]|nr:hypothetical protein [Candidatus Odinarchaeota archaeon]
MIVDSTISHTRVRNGDINAAYITSVIELRNINRSAYEPIAEAVRRFHPILTYYLYPNNPVPYLNRLEIYNITKTDGPLVWFNPSIEKGVNVIIFHNLSNIGDIYCGDMFPIFFKMSLVDSDSLIRITVQIPDPELIELGKAWIGCEDKLMWYPPFLKLIEYPNGTDIYEFNRTIFDFVLPNLKEGILAILRSMTTTHRMSTEAFRFDMWTPAAVILPNKTSLNGVKCIDVEWIRYPPYTWEHINMYDFSNKRIKVTIYTFKNRTSLIVLENGEKVVIPRGVAVDDIPNPDQPSVICWSNFTRATIVVETEENSPYLYFHVEDGKLWTSVCEYLIWNGEENFLRKLEDAINKLGEALNFEWLKTPLEQWQRSHWNETIKLENATKLEEKALLQVFNKTGETYTFFKNYTLNNATIYIRPNNWTEINTRNNTVLVFNDQTLVKIRTFETQRSIVIENGKIAEIKTHISLRLHCIIPWPYGDPEARLILPKNATDISIRGDLLTFKIQRLAEPVKNPLFQLPIQPSFLMPTIVILSTVAITYIFIRKRKSSKIAKIFLNHT